MIIYNYSILTFLIVRPSAQSSVHTHFVTFYKHFGLAKMLSWMNPWVYMHGVVAMAHDHVFCTHLFYVTILFLF